MLSVAHLLLFSLLFILTEGGVSVNNPFYCYSKDPIRPQLTMFPSITAYRATRRQNINPNVSVCNPSKLWMLSRHGTGLPVASEITSMIEHNVRIHKELLQNYDQGKTSICASDIELLENWKLDPNITYDVEFYLAQEGWDELEGLAKRYQSAFPSLFPSTYSSQHYFFRTANMQRTITSFHAFADGLFGVNGFKQVQFENIPELDVLLSSYRHCPLFANVTANRIEYDEFREGPEFQEMTIQVSAKLGFHRSHTLKNNEIEAIRNSCIFEQGWDLNSTAPFCAFFSVANHEVFEYYWDLFFYYYMGYGLVEYRRLIENLNCFIMQDMLRFLQSNDVHDHKVRMFNGQIQVVAMTLIIFGAFEDKVPLTRHNFAQQSQRLWKIALIVPMGANLAVIRYDCSDGDNEVLFLLNEEPLQIAGCDSNGLCKLSLILDRFSRFLDANCIDVFCTNS